MLLNYKGHDSLLSSTYCPPGALVDTVIAWNDHHVVLGLLVFDFALFANVYDRQWLQKWPVVRISLRLDAHFGDGEKIAVAWLVTPYYSNLQAPTFRTLSHASMVRSSGHVTICL